MKALGILGSAVLSIFIGAMIQAAAMQRLWLWFLSAEYGTGPSLGAWYGISTIVALRVQSVVGDRSETDPVDPWRSIKLMVIQWIGIAVILGVAWAVGAAFGWIGGGR